LDPFQLSEDAVLDIEVIWLYLLEREGLETADRIVTEIFKSFYKLAEIPSAGHRRVDLTSRKVLFYRIFSYASDYLNVCRNRLPAVSWPRVTMAR